MRKRQQIVVDRMIAMERSLDRKIRKMADQYGVSADKMINILLDIGIIMSEAAEGIIREQKKFRGK